MTDAEVALYFSYHNSNMKMLELGYQEIRNKIKQLYTTKNAVGNFIYSFPDTHSEKISIRNREIALSRILSGIQVSWAEESIKRLLYEPAVFTDVQRDFLLERPSLEQRWFNTLHLTFCVAYDLVPSGDPTCRTINIRGQRRNLGNVLVDQYFELRQIICDYLSPNFSIRNKVQHGEWRFAFEPGSKIFSSSITSKVHHENIITTTSRFNLVASFYRLLVDMGRFKSDSFKINSISTPFEYFYSHEIKKIRFEVKKIIDPQLDRFIADLVDRKSRESHYRNRSR